MPHETTSGIRYDLAGAGPVVLLVHGYPLDRTLWADQMAPISARATVVAVDLRGFGGSPRAHGRVLTMDGHASDCDLLLEELDAGEVDVVGLSMGGYVALALADLFGFRVRSLVLMDTRAEADSDEGKTGRQAAAERVVAEGAAPMIADLAPKLLAPNASLRARARFRTMAEATSIDTYVGALLGMRERPDRSRILEDFDGPITVVSGAEDALIPVSVAEEMASTVRHGELVVIPAVGHLPPLEDPEATTAAILRHLDRL